MVQEIEQFKCGTVAIVGRPNVGKSTLMNAILGVKLSIATAKPQTTRNRIVGVHTVTGRGQLIFVDTPGVHEGIGPLNRAMVNAAIDAARSADIALVVVDATSLSRRGTPQLWGDDARVVDELPEGIPIVLAMNKIDLLPRRHDALPLIEAMGRDERFVEIVPISAGSGINTDRLVDALIARLPEGEMLFPEDMLTDRAERFIAMELIREQVLIHTHAEVPYSVAVEIAEFVDGPDGVLHIAATIHVERESQKGIVIGKDASRLKQIGTYARAELETFFGRRVDLRTLVRVESAWTQSDRGLQRFGYGEEEI